MERARALSLLLALCAPAGAAEIPPTLRALVLHPSHRPVASLALDGVAFEALAPFSARPYVLWPADPDAAAPFERERESVRAWIERAGPSLGHTGFAPVFEEELGWRGDEVWSYRLRRGGIPMHDGRVLVHWDERGLVGLVNELPGDVLSVEEPDGTVASPDWIYCALPEDAEVRGGRRLVLARVETAVEGAHRVTRYRDRTGRPLLVSKAGSEQAAVGSGTFRFTEYPVPAGFFPDQIDVDSTGRVWFSQPNSDLIGSFDPETERFASYPMPAGASGPDGLIVARDDRVWTGLYYQGGLGVLDPAGGTFTHYDAPYSGAQMAIPLQTRDGRVWVTDHVQNRISELDPATGGWVSSYVMPTPLAYVVAGAEDTLGQRIYFTEYNLQRLAVKPPGGAVYEVGVLGIGPAFLAVSGRRVYYSLWNQAALGAYDVETGQVTLYPHPHSGELGGPLARTPDGDIVVGTRDRGLILVFDVETETFTVYPIPTTHPGLKDGLVVDRRGTIWVTESGVDKLGKLELR